MNRKSKKYVDLNEERYGLFMNDESFDLEVEYGRNFLRSDNVQEVILHSINIIETKVHSLYGQSKGIDKKFMPPIPLSVIIRINPEKQEYYGNGQGGIVRDDSGTLEFGIYLKELEEKGVEIKRGDIIEYNMSGENDRYYEVENANNISDASNKTLGGFKPYYKHVIAVPIKGDVVEFFK